jgi:hypothetical protein
MRTIDKINAISQELFKCNFIFLDKPDQDEVFAHYLAKYATNVQPKSRNYNRYTELKK